LATVVALQALKAVGVKHLQLILQHVLAGYLLYITCGKRLMQKTPQVSSIRSRSLTGYWNTMRWQWACVLVLVAAIPLPQLMYNHTQLLSVPIAMDALMFVVLGNILMGMYLPIVLAWRSSGMRRLVLAPFVAVRAWLPTTPQQRMAWVALSLTTGICEELLFRGFLIQYLMHSPWTLSFASSAIISCVVFAAGHAYQGRRGMLQTLLFSVAMIVLLIATGSLVAPIVVHVLVNLRIAFLPSPRLRVAAP
jgi:membrane protease YdiL (CAAX protease family)